MAASNAFNSCYSTPSVCPVNWSSSWSAPSPFAAPSPFWANNWSAPSNTFGGEFPWTNTFGGNFNGNVNGNFGGNPWTNGWNFPSTFQTAYPSAFPTAYPSAFPTTYPSWSRHALPTEYRDVPSRPMSIAEYWSLQNPIFVHPVDGTRMLHVAFDVKGFKPEEIKVEINAKERSINIECKAESKVEKEHNVARSYTRKFVIPEYYGADLSKCEIKSHVTAEGLLIIESVLPHLSVEELKNLKEKVPTKSTPFNAAGTFAGHKYCGPTISIPLKIVA